MTIVASLAGLAASVLLLAAGYLAGLRQGIAERDRLRLMLEEPREDDAGDAALRATIQEALGPLQEALGPLVERERAALDISLVPSSGRRSGLASLLDAIATAGDFKALVLGNEDGLPLAASPPDADQDRLLAAASRLFVAADRFADMRSPLSILIRHGTGRATLCRIFRVRDQRVFLTAASEDPRLASSALDPALDKIEAALVGE